jgi:hypothetical protein
LNNVLLDFRTIPLSAVLLIASWQYHHLLELRKYCKFCLRVILVDNSALSTNVEKICEYAIIQYSDGVFIEQQKLKFIDERCYLQITL